MVKIKRIAKILRGIIHDAENGKPYSLTFAKAAILTKARITLTGEQWRILEDLLKESYDLFVDTWIIPKAKWILHILGEEDHEWDSLSDISARCVICDETKS